MAKNPVKSLSEHFKTVEDPRVDRTKKHALMDIIIIAICGVICGADDWVAIERFGKAKEGWFRTFLALPNGIPSHDTFGRVFSVVDPDQFQHSFLSWVGTLAELSLGELVTLDGKTLRRSHDRSSGKAAIHMVSAWASANRLVLGQVKVDEKSNEITAMPDLLSLLVLKGCIVTTDAMGCQTEIVRVIIDQEADYVISLKGNQGTLHQNVEDLFAYAEEINFRKVAYATHQTVDVSHGRVEIRRYTTIFEPEFIAYLDPNHKWAGLRTMGKVETERRQGQKVSHETRYYISSLAGDPVEFGRAVRGHWHIENCLHWVLDIAFREDESRVRSGYAAQNLAVLRHIALNLLKQETSAKCGIKNKRLTAGWDNDYLLKVLLA
jgi:predicted transposase YbfD/YdcC